MKKTLLFITLSIFGFQSFSQSWHQLMYDTNATFFDVQKAFYDEWGDKPYERGKGYKQFKRWEYFMQNRIDENGKLDNSWVEDYYKSIPSNIITPSVYQSSNSNTLNPNWELIGPIDIPPATGLWSNTTGIGRVNCVAFDPNNNNILYVGTPAGGIWKSIDGGQNWTTTSQFLNSLGVSCIVVDPNNSNIIYVGTGDKDGFNTFTIGVLKSTDGGQTWQSIGLENESVINDIIINPNNSQNIIVATQYNVLRTIDGGINWTQVLSENINKLSFKPNDTNIIYGVTNDGGSFYKSSNNGSSWSQITSGLPASGSGANRGTVSVCSNNSSIVYVAFTNYSGGFYGIYKSTDSGLNFSEQMQCTTPSSTTPNLLDWSVGGDNTANGQGFYDFTMEVNPSNENEVYIGGINIWKSTDGGLSWNINAHWVEATPNVPCVHGDQHHIVFHPNTLNLYSCNDGGIYLSTDNGSSWNHLSDGLSISQYYDIGLSPFDTTKVLMGAQDNGTFYKDGNIIGKVGGGDGMQCFFDSEYENIMYSSVQFGDILKSTDSGYSFTSISPFQSNTAWQTPFTYDKEDPTIIYTAGKQVYKSTDKGDNWTTISPDSITNSTHNITVLEPTTDNNTIYFSFSTGIYGTSSIYKTSDGGATWDNITPNTANTTSFGDIAAHEGNPNRIWTCQEDKIWESQDGGTTWTNISATYSGPNINCILHSRGNKAIYIGTDRGVYTSSDSIINWTSLNNGILPNVIVTRLELQKQTNTLYAATYGRGLWKAALPVLYPPISDFEIVGDDFSCDLTVKFKDKSTFLASSWLWDFGDGNTSTEQNPTHTYSQGGQYTITLTVTNDAGSDSKTLSNYLSVMDVNVDVQPQSVCQNTSATLVANSIFDISWYSDSQGQNLLDTGSTYMTPLLNNSTTYYVQSSRSYNAINSGIDKTITTTGDHTQDSRGLIFDVHYPSVLKSVKVYSSHDISRKIQLVDANANVLADTIVYTAANPNGQVIDLNFDLPVQNGLELKEINIFLAWDEWLYSNSHPDWQTFSFYPIPIGDVVTLTSNTFGDFSDYNYFYDWVVQKSDCKSNMTAVNVNINVAMSSTINQTICSGDSYSFGGNTYTTSGTYTDTYPISSGCDSTVILNLVVSPPAASTVSHSACNDYTWNGTTYNSSGTYTHTTSNAAGCDSTATLNLTINQPSTSTTSQSACSDYTWNGTTYNSSGTYTYTTTNAAGCDSTATLNLTINQPSSSTSIQSACSDYTWNGTTYNSSGTYTYTTTNTVGCDSVATLNLTINQPSSSTISQSACSDYTWNGTTYNSSGTYTYTTTNAVGCDSTATLNLTINQPSSSTSSQTACNDYTWNGTTYNSSGTYTYTTTNSAGCDSTATLNLTINQPSSSTSSQTTCNDYTWNGTTYNSSGTYTYTTTNSAGCDSTATLNLTINQPSSSTSSQTACNDYTWNGTTYNSSGTYNFTTTNAAGCDSVATLNLTIQNGSTWDTISACNSYTWNGTNYTSSGIYTDVLPCGTATLNLTVNATTNSSQNQTACNDFTWNGTTYNASGLYTFTTTNAVGCDSIASLNLTINSATASTHSQTACDSYTWNGNTYNSSGTYTYTTTNAVGCDSTATLNLTVNPATSSSVDFITCDSSYTWNGTDYTNSGTYTFATQNSNGCDSTATLVLTLVDLSTPSINGSTSVNQTDNYDYDISVQSSGNAVQWGIDNGTINSGQNTNMVNVSWGNASYTGAIWAIETDTNGCLSDTAKLLVNIDSTVSIVENSLLNIKVYPNPFDNYTTVEFDNPQNEQYSIRLIDIRGRLVQQHNTNGEKWVLYKKQLNEGIYYLEVEGRYKAREIIVIQ